MVKIKLIFYLVIIFLFTGCQQERKITKEQADEVVLEFASLLEEESLKFKHKSF